MFKTLVTLALMACSQFAFAQSNISVNIDGRVYQCTPGGSSGGVCDSKVQTFVKNMKTCTNSYSKQWCLEQYWPRFKENNPGCLDEGSSACTDICRSSYSLQWCMERCS